MLCVQIVSNCALFYSLYLKNIREKIIKMGSISYAWRLWFDIDCWDLISIAVTWSWLFVLPCWFVLLRWLPFFSLVFNRTLHPPNWNKNVYDLDPENPDNNGYKNEDLMVWMRTAALPSFRKLYRRLNRTDPNFSGGLPKGSYTLQVQYGKHFHPLYRLHRA